MGLGSLSKYTNLFQWICWGGLLRALAAGAERISAGAVPGCAACSRRLPAAIVIGNVHTMDHVQHVASRRRFGNSRGSAFFHMGFSLAGSARVESFFFLGALWRRRHFGGGNLEMLSHFFLFSMGAPVFLLYLALSLHARIELNWNRPLRRAAVLSDGGLLGRAVGGGAARA